MVELEIPDGDPWWLSTDVWAVPGSDPLGSEGTPVAGDTCYLWARVTNNGTGPVSSASVRFYWADPSVGFDRDTANLVGTSYVSLDAGETSDVLCLTPWVPTFVNDGHECILAEAFHSSYDPLPSTPAFNVSTDRHVAQRNLSVIEAPSGFFSMMFLVVNRQRKERQFTLRVTRVRVESIAALTKRLRIDIPRDGADGRGGTVGIVDARCPSPDVLKQLSREPQAVKVKGWGKAVRTIVGSLEGGSALYHVEQLDGNRPIGGLSVLALRKSGAREVDHKHRVLEGRP